MAEAIGSGLTEVGVLNKIYNVAVTDRNDLITEVLKTKAVIGGGPTFNNGLLPTIRPILEDLKGLRFQNKIGAAFGSYGWSGESVDNRSIWLQRYPWRHRDQSQMAAGAEESQCRKWVDR